MTWNSLTDNLRDPSLSTDSFHRQLKTFLFSNALCIQRVMPRLHMIHVARIQVVSTCIPCRRLHVSCIGDKIDSKHFCLIIRPCVFSALEIFLLMRYINRRLTYLLTYSITV